MNSLTISPFQAQKALTECFGNEAPVVVDIGECNAIYIRDRLLEMVKEKPKKRNFIKIALNYLSQFVN